MPPPPQYRLSGRRRDRPPAQLSAVPREVYRPGRRRHDRWREGPAAQAADLHEPLRRRGGPGRSSSTSSTPADMTVIYDELDLAPGKVRIKPGGGNGGHNGLRSIDPHLGTDYRPRPPRHRPSRPQGPGACPCAVDFTRPTTSGSSPCSTRSPTTPACSSRATTRA